MATKEATLDKLEKGLACVRLSPAACKTVDNVEFEDNNGVRRACALESIPLSTRQWCRDRLVL